MGLGGVLVRKVFFKNRNSDGSRDGQDRNSGADRRKWISVKNYLCGDELNSLVAEDDFASARRTEAILTHSEGEVSGDEVERMEQITGTEDLQINLSIQEKAAIIIQSAFRGFRTWRQYQELKLAATADNDGEFEQRSVATEALSTIAQVGDSVEAQDAILNVSHNGLRNVRIPMCRIKEEWDDSTLSSNVMKLRNQNRLEAMTRRERALAYAFSQQLRTSSKKKSTGIDATDPGKGWSWLERWMAVRSSKNLMAHDCPSNHLEPLYYYKRPIIIRKRFEVAFEEKESCGSNDVPVSFNGSKEAYQVPASGYSPVNGMLKATKSVTKRRILPEYHHKQKGTQESRGDSSRETEERKCKPLYSKSMGEIKFNGAS